ncbi:MAG: hypothetical protein EAZ55_10390 [Cytophagales bacterium]|nr:MAG: hypothetical protein EAZ55_10390 [Cytophagales bacterium]
MKKNHSLFLLGGIIAILAINPQSKAQQISPQEQKLLIKELKSLYKNIEQYKAMKDKYTTQKKEYITVEQELKKNKAELEALDRKLKELIAKEQELAEYKASLEKGGSVSNKSSKYANDNPMERPDLQGGTWYKVQFEVTDNDLYKERYNGQSITVFTGDTDGDNAKKYTVAFFNSEAEAKEFNKYLNSINIKSKIVKYQEGQKQ